MMGLFALADPLIHLILTDKWSGTIILIQILCLSSMWYPVHAINLNLLQVKGRSDLFLRLEIVKKIIGVLILCITIPFGIIAMCSGLFFTSILALFVNTYYTGKLINLGFLKQMRDLFPSLIYSFSMGAIVWVITQFIPSNGLALFSGILIGALYYFFISCITKSGELLEIIKMINDYRKQNE
jgi:O-antigen/teichoic acid export membrane protein